MEVDCAAKPQVLVADMSAVPDIEYTALKMLVDLEEKLDIVWFLAVPE